MQQYTQTLVVVLITIGLTCLISPALGISGVKDHGDSCNILASGVQFISAISGNTNQYAEACDVEKGLVCAINKCSCLPTQEYQQNIVEKIFGGGRCGNGASAATVSAAMVLVVPIAILGYFRG